MEKTTRFVGRPKSEQLCGPSLKSTLWPADSGILQASHFRRRWKEGTMWFAPPPPPSPSLPLPLPGPLLRVCFSQHRSRILWKSLQLSSEKSQEWPPFLQEEDFFFPFLKFSITFSLNVCEEVPRSDRNCSSIEITENKLMREKKSLLFYLFQYLKEKCADVAHYFYLKYLLLQKWNAILWRYEIKSVRNVK